jgi:hypothetical protein
MGSADGVLPAAAPDPAMGAVALPTAALATAALAVAGFAALDALVAMADAGARAGVAGAL